MASLFRALRPAAAVRRQLVVPFARCAASSKGPVHIEHEHNRDLDVGELQGASFKIEPLRRTGEDEHTMRARLLYQSRKRGILESDLLMSTFANAMLPTMTKQQMVQYDLFLDENDWDIYYWATQDESPGPDTTPTTPKTKSLHQSTTAGAESYRAVPPGSDKTIDAGANGNADPPVPQDVQVRVRKDGEWAQTIGTFKPAYRPVPARWKDSEILLMLRDHVRSRRADPDAKGAGRGRETPAAEAGKGMGFMPPLFEMKR